MRLGLIAPLGEATIASGLTTLRTSNGDVVDGHIAAKRDGVVGRRGRVDALAGGGGTGGSGLGGGVTSCEG